MDQDTLRLIIRRKLAQDELPHDGIPRFWGGPANGEECDACEGIISSAQFVMEGISSVDNQGLQLHVECFSVWDMERDVPGRKRATTVDMPRQLHDESGVIHIVRQDDTGDQPGAPELIVTFRGGKDGNVALQLGRAKSREALTTLLSKLGVSGAAIETAYLRLTTQPHHEIRNVTPPQTIVREVGL